MTNPLSQTLASLQSHLPWRDSAGGTTVATVPVAPAPAGQAPVTANFTERMTYLGVESALRIGGGVVLGCASFAAQHLALRMSRNLSFVSFISGCVVGVVKAWPLQAVGEMGPKLEKFSKESRRQRIGVAGSWLDRTVTIPGTAWNLKLVDGLLDCGGFMMGAFLASHGRELFKQFERDVEGIADPNAQLGELLLAKPETLLAIAWTTAATDVAHYIGTAVAKACTPSAQYEWPDLKTGRARAADHFRPGTAGSIKSSSELPVRLLTAAIGTGWAAGIGSQTNGLTYIQAASLSAIGGGVARIGQGFAKEMLCDFRMRRIAENQAASGVKKTPSLASIESIESAAPVESAPQRLAKLLAAVNGRLAALDMRLQRRAADIETGLATKGKGAQSGADLPLAQAWALHAQMTVARDVMQGLAGALDSGAGVTPAATPGQKLPAMLALFEEWSKDLASIAAIVNTRTTMLQRSLAAGPNVALQIDAGAPAQLSAYELAEGCNKLKQLLAGLRTDYAALRACFDGRQKRSGQQFVAVVRPGMKIVIPKRTVDGAKTPPAHTGYKTFFNSLDKTAALALAKRMRQHGNGQLPREWRDFCGNSAIKDYVRVSRRKPLDVWRSPAQRDARRLLAALRRFDRDKVEIGPMRSGDGATWRVYRTRSDGRDTTLYLRADGKDISLSRPAPLTRP